MVNTLKIEKCLPVASSSKSVYYKALSIVSSAEMAKYAANTFLATKISFINEIANIYDRVGADVVQVAQGIGLNSGIDNRFLKAGIGWGGSCFLKDVSALVHTANDNGYEVQMLRAASKPTQKDWQMAVMRLFW